MFGIIPCAAFAHLLFTTSYPVTNILNNKKPRLRYSYNLKAWVNLEDSLLPEVSTSPIASNSD